MNAIPLRTRLRLVILVCLALTATVVRAQQRRTQPNTARPKATQTKSLPRQAQPAQMPPAQVVARGKTALVQWRGRPGVSRYRLQVARDHGFQDIVLDRAVMGLSAQVELPQGDAFFWRVAPAAQETGEYSAPASLTVSARAGGTAVSTVGGVLRSPDDVGWQAFTGDVARPQGAPLRAATTSDVVGVNTAGTVFALDGTNGSALWTARFRPNARRGEEAGPPAAIFTPIVVRATEQERANIVVAYDGGVRALEGETGRELWHAPLAGAAVGGAAADLDNDKLANEVAVVTAEPALYFIDARNGKSLNRVKLEGAVIGAPVPFITGTERGIALALAGGMFDLRRLDGSRFRAVKFDVPFTTAPLVFTGQQGSVVVLGTEHGLLLLRGDNLQALGKIATPGDHPRGRLAATDLDRDGVLEIVALMESGKVAVVSAAGRIVWAVAGAGDAYAPTFVDLDGDGVLDILVASGQTFAQGFSGRDGTLLWQVDEARSGARGGSAKGATALRSLALIGAGVAPRPLVVSGDASHAAVRAVGLPNQPVKVAAQ